MKDNYPTRLHDTGKFIQRIEPVAYRKPNELSINQYDFYVENGYLLIENFFNEQEITDCRMANVENGLVTNDPKINAKRAVTGIHNNFPFNEVLKNNKLVNITKILLGSDVYIHQSRINYKAGLGSSGWYWHSDFETWHAQDGMPGMRCLSAMIPLTENTECNGSLMVIPGSHKYFYSCKKEKTYSAIDNYIDQKEGVPDTAALYKFFEYCNGKIEMIKCKPTDLVLFDCNTIHVSTQNMTPFARTNLFFVYNSIENKLVKPFSVNVSRPEEMGTRKISEVL